MPAKINYSLDLQLAFVDNVLSEKFMVALVSTV